MVGHRRAPGVQHGGDADAGAEMLGIGRDGEHGLGRGLEQQVVDHGLVLVGDIGDRRRQREHDVEVADRQQLGLALGEPLLGGGALTLGAMPVAAAVVGDDGVGAVLAARDMAAERRRAAALDGRHHLQLVEADVARHWPYATPPRGRGRYPRPPALDGTWPAAVTPAAGLLSLALPGLLARLRQQVERALDAGDHAGGDARIARRGVQFVVAQAAPG